jgi:hypothetical protein
MWLRSAFPILCKSARLRMTAIVQSLLTLFAAGTIHVLIIPRDAEDVNVPSASTVIRFVLTCWARELDLTMSSDSTSVKVSCLTSVLVLQYVQEERLST